MPVGTPTMSPEQEREWVERMRSGLGAFPSANPRTERGESTRKRRNPDVRSTRRDAGSNHRREELAEKYRRELHDSLPAAIKQYLS